MPHAFGAFQFAVFIDLALGRAAITADRLGQDCGVSAPGMRAPWAASAAPVIWLSQRS